MSPCRFCSSEAYCTSCASGFQQVAPGSCQKCPDNCQVCALNNAQMECQTCNTFYEPDVTRLSCICQVGLFMVNGVCQPSCPLKTYEDEPNRKCLPCPEQCASCISPTSCQSCITGYRISPLGDQTCICLAGRYQQHNSTNCVDNCAEGYYKNNQTFICTACHGNCQACIAAGNQQCTKCNSGSFLYGFTCDSFCPTGFFPNSTTRTCQEGFLRLAR